MATTTAMKVVRNIVGKNALVFNDKLNNGVRSIKVDYWSLQNNTGWETKAAQQLQAMGFTVKIVNTAWGATRIHVG